VVSTGAKGHTNTILRRITLDGHPTYELHTFADSSEKGYAAVVYLRCISGSTIQCHLITAKSKVAPLKHVTIPRLELCGALLAAKLLHSVHHIFASITPIATMHAWTDSTTTLAWIKSSPHRWATFVANRTSQLQELTPPSIWRYVPTIDNPADCASRGSIHLRFFITHSGGLVQDFSIKNIIHGHQQLSTTIVKQQIRKNVKLLW